MLLNKSLRLAANNWQVMVKALLCQVFVLSLTIALCYLLFGSLVEDVIGVVEAGEWEQFLSDTVTSIGNATFNGENFASQLTSCIDKTQQAIEAIPNMWNRVEFSYLTIIAVFWVYRMLIAISDVAVSFQLHEFMTSNTQRMFTWFFFKKFGESCKFMLLQTLLTLPLDFLVILGGTGVCLIFVLTLKWWSIIPAVVIFLLLYSARLAYCAFWLPALATEGATVSKSLKQGLATIPYRFWKVFGKTFPAVCVIVAAFVAGALYVENNVLKAVVCTVPGLCVFFVLKCVNFVEYFEATNRPYFFKHVDVEGTERFNKKRERKNRRKKTVTEK